MHALSELENEIEPFVYALLANQIDHVTDRELLDVFCQVALHPDVGLLVKDWTRTLEERDQHDYRMTRPTPINLALTYVVSRLELLKPKTPTLDGGPRLADIDVLPPSWAGKPLWRLLTFVTYIERDAWHIDAQIPVEERKRLSQRVLDDIVYIEEQSLKLQRGPDDELFIDGSVDPPGEERLEKLRRRILAIWKRWFPEEMDEFNAVPSDNPPPRKRRRLCNRKSDHSG